MRAASQASQAAAARPQPISSTTQTPAPLPARIGTRGAAARLTTWPPPASPGAARRRPAGLRLAGDCPGTGATAAWPTGNAAAASRAGSAAGSSGTTESAYDAHAWCWAIRRSEMPTNL